MRRAEQAVVVVVHLAMHRFADGPRVARGRDVAADWPIQAIQASASAIVLLTQLPSLPINTFSIAGTSELNIVVVLSLPTFFEPGDRLGLRVGDPADRDASLTGHASGWFFQYPGVPVPGCATAGVKNPKSVSWLLPPTTVTVVTLNPRPSGTPSLSRVSSPTSEVEVCVPVGI